MGRLKAELWTGLAGALDASQMAKARALPLDRLFPHSGTNMVKVELWQDANGDYHYAEEEKAGGTNARPILPPPSRYRSLLDATPPSP